MIRWLRVAKRQLRGPSREEVAATVSDDFPMQLMELAGQHYNKTACRITQQDIRWSPTSTVLTDTGHSCGMASPGLGLFPNPGSNSARPSRLGAAIDALARRRDSREVEG